MYVINGIVYADSEADSVTVKDAKALDGMIMVVTFSNETRGLSFLSFCGIEIFGKMAIVVKYELINPVRQKRDICLRSVNGAKSKMAKQSPVEIIAIVRPGII